MKKSLRKDLSASGMYSLIHEHSKTIVDHRRPGIRNIPVPDAVMSAITMFGMKYSTMFQFCKDMRHPDHDNNKRKQNRLNLFHVSKVPSETAMREILDPIPTDEFQKYFKLLFSRVQRGKILESYSYLDGKYLLSIDGTEFFNSSKIHCDNCCEKKHRDGSTTYHHQMVAGAVVHPSHKNVIPIAPEPISKQDGCDKNDCERVASERFLRNFRREHPHLPVIVTEDGLASNAPHIKLLNELDCNYT